MLSLNFEYINRDKWIRENLMMDSNFFEEKFFQSSKQLWYWMSVKPLSSPSCETILRGQTMDTYSSSRWAQNSDSTTYNIFLSVGNLLKSWRVSQVIFFSKKILASFLIETAIRSSNFTFNHRLYGYIKSAGAWLIELWNTITACFEERTIFIRLLMGCTCVITDTFRLKIESRILLWAMNLIEINKRASDLQREYIKSMSWEVEAVSKLTAGREFLVIV